MMKHPFSKDQLQDLPHEIHLAVMDYLDPLDIISLSMTCHSFHITCSERSVWTSAFRRMCSLNMVFVPSYPPIKDMSTAELRQHATSPSRLAALLSKREGFALGHTKPCRSARYIQHPDVVSFFNVFLVPGGRYLITMADDLFIWDLGLTPQDQPSLAATLQNGLNIIQAVQPTADGNGFLVAVSAIMAGPETSIVYYNASTKELSPLARLNHLNHHPGICALTKSLFIYIHGGALVFWSFYDDLWASYTLDENDSGWINNIVCQGTTVFLFCDETVSGYEMPSLTALKRWAEFISQPASEKSLHAIFVLTTVLPDVEFNFVDAFPLESWYGGGPLPFSFDVAHGEVSNQYFTISSYCIQPPSSATDSANTDWKLTTQYNFRSLLAEGVIACSRDGTWPPRICNGYVVRTAQNGSRLTVLATDLRACDPSPLTRDSLLPQLDLDQRSQRYTFDPIPGRLCIPVKGGRIIAVLDFLQQAST